MAKKDYKDDPNYNVERGAFRQPADFKSGSRVGDGDAISRENRRDRKAYVKPSEESYTAIVNVYRLVDNPKNKQVTANKKSTGRRVGRELTIVRTATGVSGQVYGIDGDGGYHKQKPNGKYSNAITKRKSINTIDSDILAAGGTPAERKYPEKPGAMSIAEFTGKGKTEVTEETGGELSDFLPAGTKVIRREAKNPSAPKKKSATYSDADKEKELKSSKIIKAMPTTLLDRNARAGIMERIEPAQAYSRLSNGYETFKIVNDNGSVEYYKPTSNYYKLSKSKTVMRRKNKKTKPALNRNRKSGGKKKPQSRKPKQKPKAKARDVLGVKVPTFNFCGILR